MSSARVRVEVEGPQDAYSTPGAALPTGSSAGLGSQARVPLDLVVEGGHRHVTLGASGLGLAGEHVLENPDGEARRSVICVLRPYHTAVGTSPHDEHLVVTPAASEVPVGSGIMLAQPAIDFLALSEHDFPLWHFWFSKVKAGDTTAPPVWYLVSGMRSYPFGWFSRTQSGDLVVLDEYASAPSSGRWAP